MGPTLRDGIAEGGGLIVCAGAGVVVGPGAAVAQPATSRPITKELSCAAFKGPYLLKSERGVIELQTGRCQSSGSLPHERFSPLGSIPSWITTGSALGSSGREISALPVRPLTHAE